jgi:hypothetical protein
MSEVWVWQYESYQMKRFVYLCENCLEIIKIGANEPQIESGYRLSTQLNTMIGNPV